jgi:hypothetical protein
MASDHKRCPANPEETAERYAMDRLSPNRTATFRLHIFTCKTCAARVKQTEILIQALRAAESELNKTGKGSV